jgi:hypothetical protein
MRRGDWATSRTSWDGSLWSRPTFRRRPSSFRALGP